MSVTIKNENYGYSVATYGDYVVIGSPPSFRNGSGFSIGMVNVKKYDSSVDQYVPYLELQKTVNLQQLNVSLSTTNFNELLTENGISIDGNISETDIVKLENEYGNSLSIYGSELAVGTRFFSCSFVNSASVLPQNLSTGSCVDIYELSSGSIYPYTSISSSFNDESGSFAQSISLGQNVLAIGCTKKFNNKGVVYIYKKVNNNWTYAQTLTGSKSNVGDYFGYSLKIDPSGSKDLIVSDYKGSGTGSVYFFVSSSTGWNEVNYVNANQDFNYNLPYVNYPPSASYSQSFDGFGYSVSIYGDNAVVGCPYESQYYEYTSSQQLRYRGAVYFYYKCNLNNKWVLDTKSYGDDNTLKDNKLGYNVDIFDKYTTVSVPKYVFPFSSSFITASLNKVLTREDYERPFNLLGQVLLYENTGSNWNVSKNIFRYKTYGVPYTVFGYDTAISDKSIVVGSPCLFADTNRIVSTSGSNYNNIHGYSYIYNLNTDLKDYHIGNIFYRNGLLVMKTSGSMFDNMMVKQNPLTGSYYDVEYQSNFTIYENQIICRIETGEFNVSTNPTAVYRNNFDYDIDGDKHFTFNDLDLILRYISSKNSNNQRWWEIVVEGSYEESLFGYYTGSLGQDNNYYVSKSVINMPEYTNLVSIDAKLDVNNDKMVNINDMFILWKHFISELNENSLKPFITNKCMRSKYQDVINYLDDATAKYNRSYIKPEFFDYEYSSSVDVTGSYLAPYITTVGLYSGTNLVAIGKLGTPIKNSKDFPINILVKWDV